MKPLHIPSNNGDYLERFENFWEEISKVEGLEKSSLYGIYKRRRIYYEAVRKIYFVCLDFEVLKEIGAVKRFTHNRKKLEFEFDLSTFILSETYCMGQLEFTKAEHKKDICVLVNVFNMITKCCIFLDRVDEAEQVCNIILSIYRRFEDYFTCQKELFATYNNLCRVNILKRNFKEAEVIIDKRRKVFKIPPDLPELESVEGAMGSRMWYGTDFITIKELETSKLSKHDYRSVCNVSGYRTACRSILLTNLCGSYRQFVDNFMKEYGIGKIESEYSPEEFEFERFENRNVDNMKEERLFFLKDISNDWVKRFNVSFFSSEDIGKKHLSCLKIFTLCDESVN